MSIINLPKDLHLEDSDSIQLYDYRNPIDADKLQINLTKNTISFLQEGRKEVIHNNKTVSIENSDFLILKSGHCLMTEKIPQTDENYRSILLFFTDDDFIQFKSKFGIESNSSTSKTSILSLQYDDFIKNLVESLKDILRIKSSIGHKMATLKFQ